MLIWSHSLDTDLHFFPQKIYSLTLKFIARCPLVLAYLPYITTLTDKY